MTDNAEPATDEDWDEDSDEVNAEMFEQHYAELDQKIEQRTQNLALAIDRIAQQLNLVANDALNANTRLNDQSLVLKHLDGALGRIAGDVMRAIDGDEIQIGAMETRLNKVEAALTARDAVGEGPTSEAGLATDLLTQRVAGLQATLIAKCDEQVALTIAIAERIGAVGDLASGLLRRAEENERAAAEYSEMNGRVINRLSKQIGEQRNAIDALNARIGHLGGEDIPAKPTLTEILATPPPDMARLRINGEQKDE